MSKSIFLYFSLVHAVNKTHSSALPSVFCTCCSVFPATPLLHLAAFFPCLSKGHIVNRHICPWPFFIRLLPLSCSQRSRPINPLWREDLSTFRHVRSLLHPSASSYIFFHLNSWVTFPLGPACRAAIEGFHCVAGAPSVLTSQCMCAVAFNDEKSQLSHGCCTAAAPWIPRRKW